MNAGLMFSVLTRFSFLFLQNVKSCHVYDDFERASLGSFECIFNRILDVSAVLEVLV